MKRAKDSFDIDDLFNPRRLPKSWRAARRRDEAERLRLALATTRKIVFP